MSRCFKTFDWYCGTDKQMQSVTDANMFNCSSHWLLLQMNFLAVKGMSDAWLIYVLNTMKYSMGQSEKY